MTITPNQVITIQTLITKHNLRSQKENIVLGFTNGRSSSVKELTAAEAGQMINYLNSLNKINNQVQVADMQDDKTKMLAHIFAMAHELGWIRKDQAVDESGKITTKKNYQAVHQWIEKYGYLKKPLNRYTYTELPTLVTAFQNMYKSKMGFKK